MTRIKIIQLGGHFMKIHYFYIQLKYNNDGRSGNPNT
jgi:hypothetical protein